jgi:hypothetical protein
MCARQAVLLTHSKLSLPTQLLFREQIAALTPLAAILAQPSSKYDKQKTYTIAKFVRCNTYKKTGGGVFRRFDVRTFDVQRFRRFLRSLLSLFTSRVFHKSFVINRIRTLTPLIPYYLRPIPFAFTLFRTLLRPRKTHIFCFQAILYSFPMFNLVFPPTTTQPNCEGSCNNRSQVTSHQPPVTV